MNSIILKVTTNSSANSSSYKVEKGNCKNGEFIPLGNAQQETSKMLQAKNVSKNSAGAKKYIITTGDISDFDGFLALPLYQKKAKDTGAEVVFIMNYPAYFNEKFKINANDNIDKILAVVNNKAALNSFKRCEEGLGYNYTADELFKVQPVKTNILTSFLQSQSQPQPDYKEIMKQIAYYMCCAVWDEILDNEVKLHFVDGGINDINPFSIDTVKNEINVYGDTAINIKNKIKLPNTNITENTQILKYNDWITENIKNELVEILMDMNGSMAFYNDITLTNAKAKAKAKANASAINDINAALIKNLKGVFIMGGVYDDLPPDTLSTMSFLNRFSSATMNQLYANEKTGKFLKDCETTVPIYIVSNNEINKNLTYGDKTPNKRDVYFDSYKDKMIEMGLLTGDFSKELFDSFYKAKDIYDAYIVPLPFKPFDVLSAYALVSADFSATVNSATLNDEYKFLTYIPKYGSTIISKEKSHIFLEENGGLKQKLNIALAPALTFALPGLEQEKIALSGLEKEIKEIPNSIKIKNITYGDKNDIEKKIIDFMKPTGQLPQGGGIKKRMNYSKASLVDLKKYAKELEIRGRSKMTKDELIESIKKCRRKQKNLK